MITLTLDSQTVARSLTANDAHAIHALMSENCAHLDRWLRWSSAVQTLQDVRDFIAHFEAKESANDGFHCSIW